jgi:hypothetical protein
MKRIILTLAIAGLALSLDADVHARGIGSPPEPNVEPEVVTVDPAPKITRTAPKNEEDAAQEVVNDNCATVWWWLRRLGGCELEPITDDNIIETGKYR